MCYNIINHSKGNMEAMHIITNTRIRVRMQVRAGKGNQNNQNYSWRNSQNNMPPPQVNEPTPKKKVDLDQALAQILTSHTTFMNESKANLQSQTTQLNNQAAQLRNLEVQMGQMANLLT